MTTKTAFTRKESKDSKGLDIVQSLQYIRYAIGNTLNKFKSLFKTKDIFNSYKNNNNKAPSQDSLNIVKRGKQEVARINDFLQKNKTNLKRFSLSQTYLQPVRILRDYKLSIRNRKQRIVTCLNRVLGISYLNDKYKKGQL